MNNVIKCPNCNCEYAPIEIFMPDNFFGGKKKRIIKDENHKLITTVKMETKELYVCDCCNQTFEVVAQVDFSIKKVEDVFSSEYSTKLKKNNIFMEED